jgi:hypothetical protein
VKEQLPSLWELCVDDRNERREDGREGGRSHLRLHYAAAEQAAAAVQVLRAPCTPLLSAILCAALQEIV